MSVRPKIPRDPFQETGSVEFRKFLMTEAQVAVSPGTSGGFAQAVRNLGGVLKL